MDTAAIKLTHKGVCPVSGLPVVRKPEWTDVRFGDDYHANLSVLGSHIILSQPAGYIRLQGVKQSINAIDKVIAEVVPDGQPYVLIENFLKLRGTALDARRYFINNMRNRQRLAGIVFYNASPLIKISVKLGKRLYTGKRDIRLAEDYTRAIESALEILSNNSIGSVDYTSESLDRSNQNQKLNQPHEFIKNEDWILNLDGFTTKMEVIDQHILHSISTGSLEAKHIEPIAELRQKLQNSLMPNGGIEYIVADVTNIRGGNRMARKLYMDSINQWNQAYPLAMYVIYGANRFMQAASHLARPFVPFKIRVADDFDSALKIVASDQADRKNQSLKIAPVKPAVKSRESDLINQYVQEILTYLGIIDWERDGLDKSRRVDSSHPFFPVFESISLIKGELDELIRDRNAAEKALREANDELEIRVKDRTAELEIINRELRTEIRERKKIESELKSANVLAERANKTKSEFLANMSHELRTPLNHIIGFTELILDKNFGDLNETQEEYLKDVHHSSRHLLSLINDILDLSKIESGKTEFNFSKIDLPALLKNGMKIVKAKAMKHSIRLSLNVGDVPQFINTDERKLKQILYNLLSNAIKFTPHGGNVSIEARRCKYAGKHRPPENGNPNGGVTIRVSDTGIGLKPEDLNRIFDPFEQVENSTSRKFQGTGLGLSLTKRLVEALGGELWVESSGEDKGSTFYFTLPI